MRVDLSLGLDFVFVHLFRFSILCVFLVLMLFPFVVLDLASSILCQEIG